MARKKPDSLSQPHGSVASYETAAYYMDLFLGAYGARWITMCSSFEKAHSLGLAVVDCIEGMEKRKVFAHDAYYIHGCSVEEIAAEIDRSPNTTYLLIEEVREAIERAIFQRSQQES